MHLCIVEGDLLDQDVEVIVNAGTETSSHGGCCCRRACRERSSGEGERNPFGNSRNTVRCRSVPPS